MNLSVVMLTLLGIIVTVVAITLLRRHQLLNSALNLDDLLMGDDGKLSKAAAVMMGSFAITTWMMVYLTISEKMSEGYLTIYGGLWIMPTVTRLITHRPAVTDKLKVGDQA